MAKNTMKAPKAPAVKGGKVPPFVAQMRGKGQNAGGAPNKPAFPRSSKTPAFRKGGMVKGRC